MLGSSIYPLPTCKPFRWPSPNPSFNNFRSTDVCDYNTFNTYIRHMFMIEQCDTFASRTPFASSAWACEEPGSGETNSTVTLKRCLRVIFQEGSKLQRSQRWQPTSKCKVYSNSFFFGIMSFLCFFHLISSKSTCHPHFFYFVASF